MLISIVSYMASIMLVVFCVVIEYRNLFLLDVIDKNCFCFYERI